MNFIKEQYFQVGKFLRSKILWIFIILSFVFLGVSVLLYFVLLEHQEMVVALFKQFTEAILSKDILGADGRISSGGLFLIISRLQPYRYCWALCLFIPSGMGYAC